MYRQGDILLIPCELRNLKGGFVQALSLEQEVVVAYGERTGHAHRLRGDGIGLFQSLETNERVVSLAAPAELTHEEHGTLAIPPGDYKIRPQRRAEPFGGTVPAAYTD